MKKSHFYPSLAGLLALIAVFLFVPFPYSIYAPAVLELRQNDASTANVLAPKSGGILAEIDVKEGEYVEKGQKLAVLKNPQLFSELNALQGELHETERDLQTNEQLGNDQEAVARKQEDLARIEGMKKAIGALREECLKLTITAPISGVVVSPYWRVDRTTKFQDDSSELMQWDGTPLLQRNLYTTIEPGVEICSIGDVKRLEAIIVVDQSKINFIQPGQVVKLKLTERPEETYFAEVKGVLDVENKRMEEAPYQLSAKGGGSIATETSEGGVERPQSPSYRVRVDFDNGDELIRVGMTAKAKIKATPQTLSQRLMRLIREVFNFKL